MLAERQGLPARHSQQDVLALYARVLADFEPYVDGFVDQVVDEICERVPEIAGDSAIRHALKRTGVANIRAVVDLLTDPDLTLDAPAAALMVADSFVTAGQSVTPLVECYRIGQVMFLEAWLEMLGRSTGDAELLSQATLQSYRRVCAYLDSALARSVERFLTYRTEWQAKRRQRQWQAVQQVLQGAVVDVDETSAALGFSLQRLHLAAVVSSDPSSGVGDVDGLESVGLQSVANAFGEFIGAGRAFSVVAGRGLVYAWLAAGQESHAKVRTFEVPKGVLVTVGTPLPGPRGFRTSHRQAERTHQAVRRLLSSPNPVRYADVAPLTLLRDDPVLLKEFVLGQLRGLARRGRETQVLRETLQVALEERMNASSASRRLNVHKNTVHYRLKSIEQQLGSSIEHQRFELEFALRILRLHGDAILDDA